MGDRVSFSGEHQELPQIAMHHRDIVASLRIYFRPGNERFEERFAGYSSQELKNELNFRLSETDLSSALNVLSAVEAAFRIDYLQRCYKKMKDNLSRKFREIHQEKGSRASLEKDIFSTWKNESNVPVHLVGDLIGTFKYRHWLAHGRYWTPKLGRKYDYESVYILAQTVFDSFPLERLACGSRQH